MPGVHSRLALEFNRAPGESRTCMRLLQQEMPQRVVRAFAGEDGMAVTHLHNLSGGILGGDQLQLELAVGPGAQAQITTTGATRIYRHRAGPDATQRTHLCVGQDALLEYLPDPLIPYAGARYQQHLSVELAEGAGLFYWEMVAPGREASGEIFAYERVRLSLELCANGEPVALECMELEPGLRPLHSPLRWGAYRYMATLYVCRVGVAAREWSALENHLAALAQQFTTPGAEGPDATVWGVSTLVAHGLVVRGLSVSGRLLLSGLNTFWGEAKQQLYQRAAHPPRKLL